MEHLETCRLKVIKTCQIITVWFLRQGITCSQADYSSCSFFLFFIKPSNTRFSYFHRQPLSCFVCLLHPLKCHRLFLAFLQPFLTNSHLSALLFVIRCLSHLTKHTFSLSLNGFIGWLLSANKGPRRGKLCFVCLLALSPTVGSAT